MCLEMNVGSTKCMSFNHENIRNKTNNGTDLEEVDYFKYLVAQMACTEKETSGSAKLQRATSYQNVSVSTPEKY